MMRFLVKHRFWVTWLIGLCAGYFFSMRVHAQEKLEALKVGDTIPYYIASSRLDIKGDTTEISDLRGQWVLLDFWTTGCKSCIKAFPKLQALQDKFDGKLQIILINPWESDSVISARLSNIRTIPSGKLPDLPSIHGNPIWKQLFPTRSVPHHVWITPEGIIYGITSDYNANERIIERLLAGERVDMILKPQVDRFDLRQKTTSEWLSSLSVPLKRQSTFTNFHEGEGGNVYGYRLKDFRDTVQGTVRNAYINIEISDIFKDIYSGVVPASIPVFAPNRVHVPFYKQSSIFSQMEELEENEGFDEWSRNAKFCYESIFPNDISDSLRYCKMFDELNEYVSTALGIRFSIVDRSKKCLVLVQSGQVIPNSKGGKENIGFPQLKNGHQYIYTNTPFARVIAMLRDQLMIVDDSQTFLSDVRFTGAVDMELPRLKTMGDLEMLNNALNKYGLKIEEQDRVIPMLMVFDI